MRYRVSKDSIHHKTSNVRILQVRSSYVRSITSSHAPPTLTHSPNHGIPRLHILRQRRRPIKLHRNRLRKSLGAQIRPLRTRMRMILGIQRIRRLIPQPLVHIRHRLPVIHEATLRADLFPRLRCIPDEPRRARAEAPALPQIVRRLRRNDDRRAFRRVQLRRRLDVVPERVHRGPVLARLARLLARAAAVRASVVVGPRRAAAVVVPEFDDHNVPGFYERRELAEASFVGVAARGAPADGFIDDGDGHVLGEVLAPAWGVG